ncbi:MAG TPA: hypothetical protein VNT81_18120 [Vicinamibacterales bacterium]|nr:hypothetical protein [Vicinamibacterales bacterium]
MTLLRTLAVVLLGAGAIAALGTQTSVTPLPDNVRAHVKDDRFQVVSTLRGLPLGVRDQLSSLFGGPYLDIADPGAAFRAPGVSDPNLPSRRLAAAACSMDHCIVYYEKGGSAQTWHAAVLHWTPEATTLEWGGSAPGALATFEAVQNAILTGAVKGASAHSW